MKCKLNIFPPKYIVCITCLFLVGILCLTSCDNIPNVIETTDLQETTNTTDNLGEIDYSKIFISIL